MGRVVVIEFTSLDGVVEDPDGRGGTPGGGWAFRHGPQAVAGDKFALGDVLDDGVLLLGRATWELFSTIWPSRQDDFSRRMNAVPKLVVSRSRGHVDEWANSTLLHGDVTTEVARLTTTRDVVVAGSTGLVDMLRAHDLVDQYRLLVFPTVVGHGRRLFDGPGTPTDLHLAAAEQVGQAVRLVYDRRRAA